MEHNIQLDCSKSPSEVFEVCKQILLPHNYLLSDKSEREFTFAGQGMYSTRQNPLAGATRIKVSISQSVLEVHAELKGLDLMLKFIRFFPPGLILILCAIFYMAGMGTLAVKITMIQLVPWIIVSQIMRVVIQKRTIRALNVLAYNIVNA